MVAMTLLVVTEPKPPTEWPRIENAAVGPQVGVLASLEAPAGGRCRRRRSPARRRSCSRRSAMMSPGRTSRLPRPADAMIDPRHAVDLFLAVLAGDGVAERGLDLARQVVAGGRERVVHPLEDGERLAVLAGPRRSAVRGTGGRRTDVQAAGRDALRLAQVVDRRLGRLHVAAHADQDVLGVLAAVGLDEVVPPAGLAVELVERFARVPARRGRSTSAGRSCPSCRSPGSAPRPTSSGWPGPSG